MPWCHKGHAYPCQVSENTSGRFLRPLQGNVTATLFHKASAFEGIRYSHRVFRTKGPATPSKREDGENITDQTGQLLLYHSASKRAGITVGEKNHTATQRCGRRWLLPLSASSARGTRSRTLQSSANTMNYLTHSIWAADSEEACSVAGQRGALLLWNCSERLIHTVPLYRQIILAPCCFRPPVLGGCLDKG